MGEGAAMKMCQRGAFTFTYCPHRAPTTPEIIIEIDRFSIERKKESVQGEIPGISDEMVLHAIETFNRATIQTAGGGGVVETELCCFTNWLY